MANVSLDEETLYYQYLINHNSTSTMLNAISGNSSDDGSLSALNALSSIGSLGSTDALSTLGSLGTLEGTGGISSFENILQTYLTGSASQTAASDATEAATMADKLSEVLKEAEQKEDTSSLTYQTVQELYQYFKEQTAGKAAALLGTASDNASQSTQTAKTSISAESNSIDAMNQAAIQGQEFDFSEIDSIVDSAFAERLS